MALSGSALFCDDIRREISGKLIIIGAYIGNLSFKEFPLEARLDCLLRVSGMRKKYKEAVLRLNHVGFEADVTTYDLSDHVGDTAVFVISEVPVKASVAGLFTVDLVLDGGKAIEIERLSLQLADEEEASKLSD